MYKTLHKKQGSVTVQLRFARSSVTFCAKRDNWFEKNDVENHPDANRYFKPKAGLRKMLEIPEGDTNKKSYKRIHRWRYSPTVAYGNNEVHLHPYKARRLSVAEAMSLQSLPKEFSLPPEMTLTDCFKTIGNGVPFLMAKGVAASTVDKGIYQIETKSDLIVFLSAETCGLEEGTYAVIESHAFDAGATAKRLSLYGQMFTVLCRGNIKMLVKES